jgi:hypothetical protein
VKRDGFDKVIGEDVLKSEPSASSKQPFTFSSWGQSVSVRRVHKPDGVRHDFSIIDTFDLIDCFEYSFCLLNS